VGRRGDGFAGSTPWQSGRQRVVKGDSLGTDNFQSGKHRAWRWNTQLRIVHFQNNCKNARALRPEALG